MTKKTIFIALSVVFFSASALIIGKIAKNEIENGQLESELQNRPNHLLEEDEDSDVASPVENVVSKESANKTLGDIDNLMDSIEKDGSQE